MSYDNAPTRMTVRQELEDRLVRIGNQINDLKTEAAEIRQMLGVKAPVIRGRNRNTLTEEDIVLGSLADRVRGHLLVARNRTAREIARALKGPTGSISGCLSRYTCFVPAGNHTWNYEKGAV